MRVSAQSPAIVVSQPTIEVSVELTGDKEIDEGIQDFLARQRAVESVTVRSWGSHAVVYVVVLKNIDTGKVRMANTLAIYFKTYFTSYGMTTEPSLPDED